MRFLLCLLLLVPLTGCPSGDDDDATGDDDDATGDDDDATGDDDDQTGDDDDATGDDDDATGDDDDATGDDDDATGDDDDATGDDDDATGDDDDATGDDDDSTEPPCLEDAWEPDDDLAAANALPPLSDTYTPFTIDDVDPDWFTIEACGDADITITGTLDGGAGPVELELSDSTGVLSSGSVVVWSDVIAASLTLEVTTTDPVCTEYTLDVLYDDSLCCAEEADEPNDDAATATPLADAVPYYGGGLTAGNEDWFEVSTCLGGDLDVTFTPTDPSLAWDLTLWETGAAVVEERLAATGAQTFTVAATGAGYQLQLSNPGSGACQRYSVLATVDETSCPAACLPDADEDDDLPGDTTGAVSATTALTGLTLSAGDDDFTPVVLCEGAVLDVDATFDITVGEVDVYVTDAVGVDLVGGGAPGAGPSTSLTAAVAGTYWARRTLNVGTCIDYSVDLTVDTSGCPAGCTDDLLEPNDDASGAFSLPGPTTLGNLYVLDTSPDWWSVPACAGAVVTASATFVNADGDIDLELLDGAGAQVALAATSGDVETATYTSAAADTVYIAASIGALCNTYTLDVLVDDTACPPACIDDPYEDYDDATAPYVVATPLTLNQMVAPPADPDWYSVDVCAGGVLSVDVTEDATLDPTTLTVEDAVGTSLATPTATGMGWAATYAPSAQEDVLVSVSSQGPTCSGYDVVLSVDETGCCAPDANEPDDAAPGTAVTATTSWVGLNQSYGNDDWYAIDLCAGAVLDVSAATDWPTANLDLALTDAAGTSLGAATGYIVLETLTYTATAAETVDLQVTSLWGDCSLYDLDIVIDVTGC